MSQKINQNSMRWMIYVVVSLLIITIGLSWGLYSTREPYRFFQETISMLGGLKTANGFGNFPAYAVFTIGFLLVSVLCLVTSIIYMANLEDFEYGILKSILLFIIAIGTFGTGIMYDLLTIVHGIGAFLFVTGFGVYNFVAQLLRYARKKEEPPTSRKWDFYLDAVMVWVLFAITLAYFVLTGLHYFFPVLGVSHEWVALSQKILLFVIIIDVFLLDREDM